jgi:hypothetical protein
MFGTFAGIEQVPISAHSKNKLRVSDVFEDQDTRKDLSPHNGNSYQL